MIDIDDDRFGGFILKARHAPVFVGRVQKDAKDVFLVEAIFLPDRVSFHVGQKKIRRRKGWIGPHPSHVFALKDARLAKSRHRPQGISVQIEMRKEKP